jgi:RHS repeat-associated protein
VNVSYAWDAAGQLVSVTDNRPPGGVTVASYGLTGHPTTVTQPTGVRASYSYDALDRVTNLAYTQTMGASPLASYAYALHATGRRLSVTESSGRRATYGYDSGYRLTSEAITGDSSASNNGEIAYALDPVGNRLARTSTLSTLPSAMYSYDENDRLTMDGYDPNGNTVTRDGATYAYDYADRLRAKNGGEVVIDYDGDGARVAKTVGGVTTRYLVDDLNPSGYSQVMEEVIGGTVQRVYTYGTMLVSQSQRIAGSFVSSFYGYDAQGNVKFLTDSTGAVTDTYAYDAFGTMIGQPGSTPNSYFYGGQQLDSDLGLYFLRARYYEPARGRFLTLDPFDGEARRPSSLHKYLYVHGDGVNFGDPSGMAEGVIAQATLSSFGRMMANAKLAAVVLALGRALVAAANGNRDIENAGNTITVMAAFALFEGRKAAALAAMCVFHLAATALDAWSILPMCKVNKCRKQYEKCDASPLGLLPGGSYGISRCGECLNFCTTWGYWPPRLPSGEKCL